MLIDSIIIKLVNYGAGIGPDYTLKIYGNGKVIFEGNKNVKVIGKVEDSIDEEKFVELLEEFKNSGFFHFDDTFTIEDAENQPFTIISIAIPKEDGKTITKNVKYYSSDQNKPYQLKNLEKKIYEIINLDKWAEKRPEIEIKKEESVKVVERPTKIKSKKPVKNRKKLYKIITICVSLIIVFSLLSYGIYTGIISFPTEEKKNDNVQDQIPASGDLEINILETASYVDFTTGNYTKEDLFFKGDIIKVYQEFKNFSTINNETCDLYLELSVECEGTIYHQNSTERTLVGQGIQIWWFPSLDNWITGLYNVTVNLEDNLSGNSTSKSAYFVLV